MYSIEQEEFGLRLRIVGGLTPEEAKAWLAELGMAIQEAKKPFGVLVDVREARLFMPEAQASLKQGMEACREEGMQRACVVLNSAVATLQARRLARETGIETWQRYVDASETPDWEDQALGWIRDEVKPRD